jgi:prepilin-type N-terminal cleavage/methylation domain-containing protein
MMMATSNSTVIRWEFPDVQPGKFNRGFSLMEVMIAVFLSSLLMSGIVQLLGSSASTYRLQLSQGQLEESARYARDILISHISQAGYQPEPWQALPGLPALTDESLDGESMPGDQLGLQRWSMQNCYGNENPIKGNDGRAAFYLLQAHFHVNSSKNLAMTCRYGPDASALVTQINNYGLVEDVESMQVLYAEDRDGDKIADTWVTGQAWQHESNIRSVKIGLLLSTPQAFKHSVSEQITLLDTSISTPADGHLRKLAMLTSAIRGRLN